MNMQMTDSKFIQLVKEKTQDWFLSMQNKHIDLTDIFLLSYCSNELRNNFKAIVGVRGLTDKFYFSLDLFSDDDIHMRIQKNPSELYMRR